MPASTKRADRIRVDDVFSIEGVVYRSKSAPLFLRCGRRVALAVVIRDENRTDLLGSDSAVVLRREEKVEVQA